MRKAAIAAVWCVITASAIAPALAQTAPDHFELEVAFCLGANGGMLAWLQRTQAHVCSDSAIPAPQRGIACDNLRKNVGIARDRGRRLFAYLRITLGEQLLGPGGSASDMNVASAMQALAQGKHDFETLNPAHPNPDTVRRIHHCLAILAALAF